MAKKVLIVDDDDELRELLTITLQQAGYSTDDVPDVNTALKHLQEKEYSVAVVDIILPDKDGLFLLGEIKKINRDTQVIMMTAQATLESVIKAIEQEAFGYIRKPFNPDELISYVNRAYEKYSSIQKNKKLLEEYRQIQEYIEDIMQNFVYAVIACDEEGKIKKVNRALEKALGYKEEELIGAPLSVIFSTGFQKTALHELIKENRVKNFPVEFLTKNGSNISAKFTGIVMKKTDGKIVGFVGTIIFEQGE